MNPHERPRTRGARLTAIASASAVALVLAGCSASPSANEDEVAAGYPVEVVDCGAPLTIEDAPTAVFTVGPTAVELIDAVGASDTIVARSGEFDAPLSDDLIDPPSDDLIVDAFDPTTEQILGSGADTVIGYGLFNADAEQLAAAGIQVITVAGECGHDASTGTAPVIDFGTISDDIRRFGAIFNANEVAEATAAAFDERVASLTREDSGESIAWVYYFSGESSISAYGSVGIPHATITSAGFENVFADESSFIDTSIEALLERQPTWITLSYGFTGETSEQALERFLAEPGVNALEAVAAGRIVTVPYRVTGAGLSAPTGLESLVSGTDG